MRILKILVVCDYGEVRSVAMAKLINEKTIHIAKSCAYESDCDDSVPKFRQIVHDFKPNIIIWMCEGSRKEDGFIGRDEFGSPDNKELIKICEQKLKELELI